MGPIEVAHGTDEAQMDPLTPWQDEKLREFAALTGMPPGWQPDLYRKP
jgi:hypothetical protein